MSDAGTKETYRARRGFLKRLIGDVFFVARRDKKWWLVPLVLMMILLGILMLVAASAGPLAPFVYPFL